MLAVADDAELAERLAARTLELVDVPSESREEAALAAHVLGVLRDGGLTVRDAGDTCVVAECGAADGPLVVLAGHFDTVPTQGNRPGRRDAEAVHGLGATDMKAALAVMVETGLLLRDAGKRVALCFFGREELGIAESALTPLLERDELLRSADLALVMEPTDNALQGGCLGNINATWTFTGRSGHSARPWLADNAITHAAAAITELHAIPVERVTFDGLEFAEVASVTKIAGGIAENVIPDTVACHVNYRYAPGRSAADAERVIQERCATLALDARHPLERPERRGGREPPARPGAHRGRAAPRGAQAGLDPRRGVRARGRPRRELRPGRPGLRAPPRRARPGRRAAEERAHAGAVPLLELNPVLTGLKAYPFVRLGDARRAKEAEGVDVIDFGIGEPREETPAFIRQALADAIEPQSRYPLAEGLPELREAAARWCGTRFGVAIDPATELVPTLGAKEAIFSLAQVVGPGGVGVTVPGYPVAERGALFAHREVVEVPLTAERDFLPDLDAIPWADLALLWLNYPNNPTAATAPLAFYEEAAARAREHGVVLASDEAYSELWFEGDAPASALQVADRTNVLALHTLSKRSSMPGYRSGFVAGDPHLIAGLKRFRPNVGVAPQTFVQRAAVAAWKDEAHVEAVREVYRTKRDALLPALLDVGLRPAGGHASFFLWLAIPEGWSGSEPFALALLDEGLVVAPGAYFGPAGEGYVRVALVPTLERCRAASERLSRWRAAPR